MTVVLVAVLVLEASVRLALIPRSKDLMNLAVVFPAQAVLLSRSPGIRVAVMGNSATAHGVDAAVVTRALEEAGVQARVDVFTADASHLNTWYFMLRKYFCPPAAAPDLVVIPYFRYSLEDGHVDDIGRLAQILTRVSDWPEVFRDHIPGLSGRTEFVIASVWASFAVRERIRDRVLSLFTPQYKEYELRLLSAPAATAGATRRRAAEPGTHRALLGFMDEARRCGTQVYFVAFPLRPPEDYPLNAEALRIIGAHGGTFIDLRHVDRLRPSAYTDVVHLTDAAAPIFSHELGAALAHALRTRGPQARR